MFTNTGPRKECDSYFCNATWATVGAGVGVGATFLARFVSQEMNAELPNSTSWWIGIAAAATLGIVGYCKGSTLGQRLFNKCYYIEQQDGLLELNPGDNQKRDVLEP